MPTGDSFVEKIARMRGMIGLYSMENCCMAAMNDVRRGAMGKTPKTMQRREAQREALVDAAERAIAGGGTRALKARELAQEIGVALGALYNLVADLDELNLLVISRTLGRLERYVLDAATAMTPDDLGDPKRRLTGFARAYRRFASDNIHLWRALFEYRDVTRAALPDWFVADQMRLFEHVSQPLRRVRPDMAAADLFLLTRTLFGAVHGVVTLGLDEKLIAVSPKSLDNQLDLLVGAFCDGISGGTRA